MERERRVNGGLGLGYQEDYNYINGSIGIASSSASSSTPSKYASSSAAVGVGSGGVGSGGVGGCLSYIEHPVSKFDTLAGVAIKYGVEVADIKRLNGLVSDLQMFALKTLQIPLPGRHPPSPILSNGLDNQGPSSSERTPSSRRHSDLFDSFQSLKLKPSPHRKVSPAMNSLQGYYGLRPTDGKSASEGFEMAVYRKEGAHYLEDGLFTRSSALSTSPRLHRKSRSVASDLMSENGDLYDNGSAQEAGDSNSAKWMEKLLVRRRQKSEADFGSRTPEMLLKEETTNGGGFSAITGKGLALRPKSASRTVSGADTETVSPNPIPVGLGDSFITESTNGVRKSSSASSLQDSDNSALASLWHLGDLQVFSTAAITKPIFDGLPKPITGRKNKAALD